MDIYAEITNRMISEMEQGIIPWQKPWMASGAAISHTTGKAYSLLNQMLLGKAGEYLTFKQVQQEGGWVHKGEKAHMVVFWKWIDKEDEETHEITQIPFLKYYNVFHISQCENIRTKYPQGNPNPANPDQNAENIIAEYVRREGVTLEHREGDAAFYQCESLREITLPAGLQTLGAQAFDHCEKLRSISIPRGVTTVPEAAFNCCAALETAELPGGVTAIENSAFNGCKKLADVYFAGSAADWAAVEIGAYNTPLSKAYLHTEGAGSGDAGGVIGGRLG